MISDVEMPSVLWVGTNIPVQRVNTRQREKIKMHLADPCSFILPSRAKVYCWVCQWGFHIRTLPAPFYRKYWVFILLDLFPGCTTHSLSSWRLLRPSPSFMPWILLPCSHQLHHLSSSCRIQLWGYASGKSLLTSLGRIHNTEDIQREWCPMQLCSTSAINRSILFYF